MKTRIRAAGVLLYAKDSFGQTWFLLGREKPSTNSAQDSCRWSELGGSMCKGETIEETAARECAEESMNVIFNDKKWLENELKTGRYLLAIDSRTPSGKGYRSFIKRVPFLNYPEKFARFSVMAKKQPSVLRVLCPNCFDEKGHLLLSCTEKTSIAWLTASQIKEAVAYYKHMKKDFHSREAQNVKKKQTMYNEHVPLLRKGFALDFENLMNTSWGKGNFHDDETHFPPKVIGNSYVSRPVIKTPHVVESTKSVRIIETEHDAQSCEPQILVANLDGYSMKKKRRKKKKKKKRNCEPISFDDSKLPSLLKRHDAERKRVNDWSNMRAKKSPKKEDPPAIRTGEEIINLYVPPKPIF